MKQKFRAAEILIALVVPTSTASAQRPAGPLMGTGNPGKIPVPPENPVQPTAKSCRQANRRLNQLAALPESVNEIPKFTTHVTETVRAQISKVRGDPARSANGVLLFQAARRS